MPAAAWAQGPAPGPTPTAETGRFVLICPAVITAECAFLAEAHAPTLDEAFSLFRRLYGQAPPLPINIRIYTDWFSFRTLNPVVPAHAEFGLHAHLGSREIAFIQPFPAGFIGSPEADNALRHELNGLFLSSLASNQLPAGLEVGINQYVEVPGPQTERAVDVLRWSAERGQLLPWRDLFADDLFAEQADIAYPQALSIVAFLVDTHGFPTLVELVRTIGTGQSYRSAFPAVYGRTADQLEAEWQAYLPAYLDERWQRNALFNYDLQPFEAGLEAGAYSQVVQALDEVIPFLEQTGQAQAAAEAQALRAEAEQGVAAEELLAAFESALAGGEHARALELATAAQAAYAQLGNSQRVHALETHIDYLRQVVALRAELETAQNLAAEGQVGAAEQALLGLVSEFDALGDAEGRRLAVDLLSSLEAQRVAAVEQRQAAGQRLLLGAGALAGLVLSLQLVRQVRRRPVTESTIL